MAFGTVHLDRYVAREGLGFWGRLRVAAGRITESEDDELAYAYYAANENAGPYDRATANRAYARRAYPLYGPRHVERGLAMVLKAIGLPPTGWLHAVLAPLAIGFLLVMIMTAWRIGRLKLAQRRRHARRGQRRRRHRLHNRHV